MVKIKTILLPLLCLALTLSGCSMGQAATPTRQSPEALFTAAAQTAEAMRLQRFGLTPSPQTAEEMVATAAAVTPTLAAPATQAATAPANAAPTQASAPVVTSNDKAEYVSDVTVQDGTTFAPGETFQKTWRISNTGATTWNTAYQLVFIDGNLLGAQQTVALPGEVAPGGQIDITVDMVAPDTAGSYTSYWKLRNPAGQTFGFGSDGKAAIWVKISVAGDGVIETAPANTEGGAVSDLSLAVDAADVADTCPHVFLVTATFVLNQPATLGYYLEVGGSGAEVRTPPPATRNLPAGTHQVVFELSVGQDFAGWARLHLTSPVNLTSDQVAFSLTCV